MDVRLITMPSEGADDVGNKGAEYSVEEEEKKDDDDDNDNEFEKKDPASQSDSCSRMKLDSTYQLKP